jgi:hypothetical protein
VATGSTTEFAASNHPRPWYLAAAAAVLVAIMGSVYLWNRVTAEQASPILAAVTHDGRAARETLRLARVRGSETMPVLEPRPVRIEIVGLFDRDSDYTLTLDRRVGPNEVEILSTVDGLNPASSTSLEVSIDGSSCRPGSIRCA